ncbi:hypothetical protein PRZ48_008515 [Zasmidium cellare]|uniref:Uncharacterized protein n=1 Tax=Zasmidium cellare TaxID=395010 RepID=A0ABR0EFN6_ZASCE|nr:hypothetical protein PRZ48_008515 [Zasmidium cellare]
MADTCDLRGWHKVEIVVGGGGPGQAPVSYTYQGFDLNYEGGVPIGSNQDDLNPIAVDGETIPAGALGQPNEIQWDPNWALTSFDGCSATYNGATYEESKLGANVPTNCPNNNPTETPLCRLRGWHRIDIAIGSGGSRGSRPDSDTLTGFDLDYECGASIAASSDMNSIASAGTTIPAGTFGLPNDLQWKPDFLVTFEGCSATYNGVTHEGEVIGCASAGKACSSCVVTFECEEGLAEEREAGAAKA